MSTTKIEWATHVLNAFTGCDRVSAGCASCYAVPTAAANKRKELGRARVAREAGKPEPVMRYQLDGDPRTSGPGFGFAVHWDKLLKPHRFPAGARVFVNSMSDVFHEDAPLDALAALWCVFLRQPEVNWLVLTKRADRMRAVLNDRSWWEAVGIRLLDATPQTTHIAWHGDTLPAPANVWLGVTVENRSFVHRADDLRATPAAVRFVSAEPLLGQLARERPRCRWPEGHEDAYMQDHDHGSHRDGECPGCERESRNRRFGPGLDLTGVDWLIAGGESNGRAGRRLVDENNQPRADRLGWVRDLRDACEDAGTAFFFKQWGGRKPTSGGRLLDGREWSEFPRSLVAAQP
jgi:protein gp37